MPCPLPLEYQAASSQARLKSCWALPPWAHLYWIYFGGAGCAGREPGGGEAPRLTRRRHQQGQAHNQHSNYILTINVPVVYMARAVMILINAFRGTLEEVGDENRDFFGPK